MITYSKCLKELTTFKTESYTKMYTEVDNEEILKNVLKIHKNEKKFILGQGSNILFKDFFDGLVIKINIPGIRIVEETEDVVLMLAGAGILWNDLVNFCLDNNYGGLENLIDIPGSVGAAPVQNVGAYGVEFKDVFYCLTAINVDTLETSIFNKEDCKFGYRNSIFKNYVKDEYIITYVTLKLKKNPIINTNYGNLKMHVEELEKRNETVTIRDMANIISEIRKSKLPNYKILHNAGSFFKNPIIDNCKYDELCTTYQNVPCFLEGDGKFKISAAWLIEMCGWKGARKGNTGTYEKHGLIIVNYGNATGREIIEYSREVKESVKNKFDILLEEEVVII